MTRVAYLPGDGIGREVLPVARKVLDAAGFQADWVELPMGWDEWRTHGDALPASTLAALRRCDAGLLGAVTSKPDAEAERELAPSLRGRGLRYRSPIVRLRQELNLYANVRPIRSYLGNPRNLSDDVDLVIFRENTEDLYAGLETRGFPQTLAEAWRQAAPDARIPPIGNSTAITGRVITRQATERLIRGAFEYASREGRKKVTLVEKANVMRATGGLVREIFQEVAAGFPSIEAAEENIDAACARLVRRPGDFDVLVATNLFGDILSDIAAEVAGGLPLAPSGNLGDGFGLFEPVHGSAPDIAGRGVANPLGAVLAAAMLARHLGQQEMAEAVEQAVARLVAHGRFRPRDLGGTTSTSDVGDALSAAIRGQWAEVAQRST